MNTRPIQLYPTQMLLLARDDDATPHRIVSAWKMIGSKLPWFPKWFKSENLQDCMEFLLGRIGRDQLASVFNIRANIPEPSPPVHIELVESMSGSRRVFIGPVGCGGMPGLAGAVNVHWEPDPSTKSDDESAPCYQRMMLSVFESVESH